MAVLKISEQAHARARSLAEREQQSMARIVEKALVMYEERSFFLQMKVDFEVLKRDSDAYAQYLEERDSWSAGWPGPDAPATHDGPSA